METVTRFFQAGVGSFFLFGPRGTGKSTWIAQYMPEALTIDLLAPDLFRSYAARPERLLDVAAALPLGAIVVIDEVQKAPELLSVTHKLMEERRDLRFVLTGSSSRKLKRSGVDLLAGRAAMKTMHPFMASEIGEEFSLAKALAYGLVPVVVGAPAPMETLKAYVGLYVREEVQMEGLVRDIGSFSRFLEAASFSHAALLNLTEVARECEVNRKTVEGYISILEDLLLAFQIPVFSRRAKRHLITHQKFYLFDAGVFRCLRPAGPLDRPEEIEGAALEGLVAQHLRAWLAYRQEECQLFFWRTKSGVEVDFVLYGPDTFYAIEVKNSSRVHPAMLTGLKRFREDYPEARACLLYRGKERFERNGVLCLPCEEFFRNLRSDQAIT